MKFVKIRDHRLIAAQQYIVLVVLSMADLAFVQRFAAQRLIPAGPQLFQRFLSPFQKPLDAFQIALFKRILSLFCSYELPDFAQLPIVLFIFFLQKTEIKQSDEIWVEPISTDSKLRDELRGWYRIKERFVENEFGNRFYFDTYGAKWLGFENILK